MTVILRGCLQRQSLRLMQQRSRRYASGKMQWEPPTGNLFGEPHLPPGQKREKELWEYIWVYGFCGSIAAAIVAYQFRPDTSISTWALEEAKQRLEAEGYEIEYKRK